MSFLSGKERDVMKTFTSRTFMAALVVLVAVAGGVPAKAASGPFQYHAITPCSVFDSRSAPVAPNTISGPLANPGPYPGRVQGVYGVPVGAAAVSANFTVVAATRPGDIRVFPAGAGQPSTSTVNYPAG